MQDVLRALVIDTESDHNTHDTAKRVAKMFLDRGVPRPLRARRRRSPSSRTSRA